MTSTRNPHFDDGRVVWSDAYAGQYGPPPMSYAGQFDLQWKLALDERKDWFDHPGASTEDAYIDDRVYEWTGHHPRGGAFRDGSAGVRVLDRPIDPARIEGRRCIDIGCGMGRWTRTLQRLGAREVVSIDISESAVRSTSAFNPLATRGDIMEIPSQHPEWVGQFDFACFWGVAMHTHDPAKAFASAASTVAPGGAMYLMVYAPEGMHGEALVNAQRKGFHALATPRERLDYVDHVYHRRWHRGWPFAANWKNLVRRIRGTPKGGRIGVLDMLEPWFNWVIPWSVVADWAKAQGFAEPTLLNAAESPRCAWHVLLERPA